MAFSLCTGLHLNILLAHICYTKGFFLFLALANATPSSNEATGREMKKKPPSCDPIKVFFPTDRYLPLPPLLGLGSNFLAHRVESTAPSSSFPSFPPSVIRVIKMSFFLLPHTKTGTFCFDRQLPPSTRLIPFMLGAIIPISRLFFLFLSLLSI